MYPLRTNRTSSQVKDESKGGTNNNSNNTKNDPFVSASKGYVLGRGKSSLTTTTTATTTTTRAKSALAVPSTLISNRLPAGGEMKEKNIRKSYSSTAAPLTSANTKTNRPKAAANKPAAAAGNQNQVNRSKPPVTKQKYPTKSSSLHDSTYKTANPMKQRPNVPTLVPIGSTLTRNQEKRTSPAKMLTKKAEEPQEFFSSKLKRPAELTKYYRFAPAKPIVDDPKKKIWNKHQVPERRGTGAAAAAAAKEKSPPKSAKSGTANVRDLTPGKIFQAGIDFSAQVNDSDILDPDLLFLGNVKVMLPSVEIVQAIERDRNHRHLQKLLKMERKFEPHSLNEKEHLTDLKEFLESAAIKKRPRHRRTIVELEEDRRMIMTMDEMLKRPLIKPESVTDIKQRIRRKEEELLSMFDSFYKMKIPGITETTTYTKRSED